MYVDVLSAALEARAGTLSGTALLDHVVACRAQLLAAGDGQAESAYDCLAAEAAYDRALIWLCDEVGVATAVANFADPNSERNRLEARLVEAAGIDLPALTRARVASTS